MDAAFNQMQQSGQNNVENLVSWMKQSKVIGDSKDAEAKAKKMFEDAPNQQDVQLDKFKEVLGKVAAEQNANVQDLTGKLNQVPNMIQGVADAAKNAFSNLMK